MNRSKRERERYNQGLQRDRYGTILKHCGYHYRQREKRLRNEALAFADGKVVLELGAKTWYGWLEKANIRPAKVHCINISEIELNKGIDRAVDTELNPQFHLMDANDLAFADRTFDVVFGSAILHHLDFTRAVAEVQRVLKPNGLIVFSEPLDMNPIGWVVRAVTPQARTVDEGPLRLKELSVLKNRFRCTLYASEFLSVPAGVVSGLVFEEPANLLTLSAYKLDRVLETVLPPIRYLYRRVLIIGRAP